jgi:hypothetical protein
MKKSIIAVLLGIALYSSFAFAMCPRPTVLICEGMPQRCTCR